MCPECERQDWRRSLVMFRSPDGSDSCDWPCSVGFGVYPGLSSVDLCFGHARGGETPYTEAAMAS
ncbi:hypothetical protein CSUI_005290 [Cystoisospora suis]|uniref:Uncharacterized protein n=1 Tax=Cystoisospora suis TaxID=483139 RepID=A0A2C6KY35_9APIC|nr:hypothetical protein CSUI_005290 [Cystoisospora suis]